MLLVIGYDSCTEPITSSGLLCACRSDATDPELFETGGWIHICNVKALQYTFAMSTQKQ